MKNTVSIRSILLLLIVSFVCIHLFACVEEPVQPSSSTSLSSNHLNSDPPSDLTDSIDYIDSLPDGLDFGGETVTIAYSGPTTSDSFYTNYFTMSINPDENSTDSISKAIYERNKNIENRLNIKIIVEDPVHDAALSPPITNLNISIRNSLLACEGKYDIVMGRRMHNIALSLEDCLVRIEDLGTSDYPDSNYINLDAPYWNKKDMETSSWDGDIYWLSGDISLSNTANAYAAFVNKSIYDTHFKDTYGDIYSLVKDKQWTVDKLTQMCIETENLNNTPGFVYSCNEAFYALLNGVGFGYIDYSEEGELNVRSISSQESLTQINAIKNLLKGSSTIVSHDYTTAWTAIEFAKGNTLCTVAQLTDAKHIKEGAVADNYYLLPLPVLNEGDDYKTYVTADSALFGIYKYSDNIPAAAATLEALCAENHRAVKSLFANDFLPENHTSQDNEMFEIIVSSVNMNMGYTWETEFGIVGSFSQFYDALAVTVNSDIRTALIRMYLPRTDQIESYIKIQSGQFIPQPWITLD